jgi:hypothetical protein
MANLRTTVRRWLTSLAAVGLGGSFCACGVSAAGTGGKHSGSTSSSATTGVGGATALMRECVTDNPPIVDTDGDGFSDCDEIACGSDPYDPTSTCYACGWPKGDSSSLTATGAKVGDTIANLDLIDQCKEHVPLWNFAGKYHILFMTAAW